jgi:hypothetical protein
LIEVIGEHFDRGRLGWFSDGDVGGGDPMPGYPLTAAISLHRRELKG